MRENGGPESATREAATLIIQLNDPRNASRASIIAEKLQSIQSSTAGWAVANSLLSSDDVNLQFYGALTFQVKLNQDGRSLDDEDAHSILTEIVGRFVQLIHGNAPTRVTDKVCSLLSTFAIQAGWRWQYALDCVYKSLVKGQPYISIDSDAERIVSSKHLASADPHHVLALLRLAKVMAEDIGRIGTKTREGNAVSNAFQTSAISFSRLFCKAVEYRSHASGQIVDEVLASYLAWVAFADTHIDANVDSFSILQQNTDKVIQLLDSADFADVFRASEALADVLTEHFEFITKDQLRQISQPCKRAQARSQDLSLEERLPIVRLAAAWGKANMPSIFTHPTHPDHLEIIAQMTQALCGFDWAEDDLEYYEVILGFWDSFGGHVLELDETEPNISKEREEEVCAIVSQLIAALFDSLDPKDDSTMATLPQDTIDDFGRLRLLVADTLSPLPSPGFIPLYGMIADQLDRAIEEKNWLRIESVIQMLADLSREWDESEISEQGLGRVVDSQFFDQINNPDFIAGLKVRFKRRLLSFFNGYSFFFPGRPARLPAVITFVMTTLQQYAGSVEKVADLAAKCLDSISTDCRYVLANHIEDLMTFCGQALGSGRLNTFQKGKVYGSMTIILTALSTEEAQVAPLAMIILQIKGDLESSKALIERGSSEDGEQDLVTALNSLLAVGKAMWNWHPPVVVLDDENEISGTNGATRSTWHLGAGKELCDTVLSCLHYIEVAPQNGDAWDAICAILRINLTHAREGPFAFPSSLISSILESMSPAHPRLETLLSTSSTFLSSLSSHRQPDLVRPLNSTVTSILLTLSSPDADPAVAQLCFDYYDRLLPRYPDVLLSLPQNQLSGVLQFSLASFTSDQPMLKRVVAAFISGLLLLPTSIQKGEGPKLPIPGLQDFAQSVVTDFLPLVAAALAHQIGGQAQRSEMEAVAKVLRAAVVAAGPRARALLEGAFEGEGWPTEARARVGMQDKRMFISKVLMLRGGRGTGDVVKEFWALCRGTVGAF